MERKRISIRLDEDTWLKYKVLVAKESTNMQDDIEKFIKERIKEDEKSRNN